MKKLTLIVSALAVLSLASCKKAYDCKCEYKRTSRTYTAVMPEWQDYVDEENAEEAEDKTTYVEKTDISSDKTTKAAARAACPESEVNTEVDQQNDYSDEDGDSDRDEHAYTRTSVYTTTCTLDKQ